MKDKIKKYFKTLSFALLGHNPFRMDLDALREKYNETAAKVYGLHNLYYDALEQMDKSSKLIMEADNKLRQANECIGNYQKLVENLRERLKEKDVIIKRMKSEFQKRLTEYNMEIDSLHSKLSQRDVQSVSGGSEDMPQYKMNK